MGSNASDGAVTLVALSVDDFVNRLASAAPEPGGGSAAALAGAMGAALVAMVAGLTVGRSRYAAYDAEMVSMRAQAEALRSRLVREVDADPAAYAEVTAAYRLPKGSPDRDVALQQGLRRATEAPLAVAAACVDVLDLAVLVVKHGNRNATGDAAVGALMAHAGLVAAVRNIDLNLRGQTEADFVAEARSRAQSLLAQGETALAVALAAADVVRSD